jgi:hypothetical protein
MPDESLTEKLDRSAPVTPSVDSAWFAETIAVMSREARAEAMTTRRTRAMRWAAGAGLAVLFTGGATAAMASGIFSWTGWAAKPDIAYPFTLPSGRQCEEHILINETTTAGDRAQTASAAGAALKSWAASADFTKLVDVSAQLAALNPADGMPRAAEDKGSVLPDPKGPDALMVVLKNGGGLDVVPKTAAGPTADDLYAVAVDTGLQEVLHSQAVALGASGDWSTNLQMQCQPAS